MNYEDSCWTIGDEKISTLEDISSAIEQLRADIIFSNDTFRPKPVQEQHYLIAISHLELAMREMKLAHLETR